MIPGPTILLTEQKEVFFVSGHLTCLSYWSAKRINKFQPWVLTAEMDKISKLTASLLRG